jgi:hypothetical protein
MKFLCMGYLDLEGWSKKTPDEQNAAIDACFAYDEVLRKGGHFAGGEAIAGPDKVVTLWKKAGQLLVTDGPHVETKELLGGLLILEARDMRQAVELMSKHPGIAMGPFEIRPTEDITQAIRESEKRRAAGK